MLADHADLHYATQMFRQGVVDYLVKPVQSKALVDVIRHAIKVSQEHPHA
jgi:FixJ family two-component response regulator